MASKTETVPKVAQRLIDALEGQGWKATPTVKSGEWTDSPDAPRWDIVPTVTVIGEWKTEEGVYRIKMNWWLDDTDRMPGFWIQDHLPEIYALPLDGERNWRFRSLKALIDWLDSGEWRTFIEEQS
jgi:hypothetical protein